MSALAFLYIVLPFLFIFVIHKLEEGLLLRKWNQKRMSEASAYSPFSDKTFLPIGCESTKTFVNVAIVELLFVVAVSAAVMVGGSMAVFLWSVVFLAFTLCMIIHLVQFNIVKGYVPGLVSAIVMLIFAGGCIPIVLRSMVGAQLFLCVVLATALVALHLCLEKKLFPKSK